MTSLKLRLHNNLIGGSNLNSYIFGKDANERIFFMGTDGEPRWPTAGGSTTPVQVTEPIAISLPDKPSEITIPFPFKSGRIYFAQGELSFSMVSQGNVDALVEPSVTADPSLNVDWGFVEITLTPEGEVWANLSYVDFVGITVAMDLIYRDGSANNVIGLPSGAIPEICNQLEKQGEKDTFPWGDMCIRGEDGQPLRVLSPEDFIAAYQSHAFDDYWTDYVDDMWLKYSREPLTIDTQDDTYGQIACRVQGEELICDRDNRGFSKPTSADIWGCNSGPFAVEANDSPLHKLIIPILCAAFVRTTLHVDGGNTQPGPLIDSYYKNDITMHYSRIVHDLEEDHKGFAFPYDDVKLIGSEDASGLIRSINHDVLVFHVGGKDKYQ